jgi:hypothetical protein
MGLLVDFTTMVVRVTRGADGIGRALNRRPWPRIAHAAS